MPPEEYDERRRLTDRRRQLERAVADGGLKRMGRRARRWMIIGAMATVGCLLLVQGLFIGGTALAADDLGQWSPLGAAGMQVIAGTALLSLAWWLMQSVVEQVRGLATLVVLVAVNTPPWGWMFGEEGHLASMILLLGLNAAAVLVYRSSREREEGTEAVS